MSAEIAQAPVQNNDAKSPAANLDPVAQAKQVQEQLVNQKIIPKKTHWEETIWKGPIDYITSHSGAITDTVGDLAGKVSQAAGGAVHSAQDSLHRGPAFNFPKIGGEQWKSRVGKKSKDQVGEWLKANGLDKYVDGFKAAEVDGTGLLALHEIWSSDKLGLLKYAQESLQITSPGHALRFGVKLEEVPSYLWEDDVEAKAKKEAAEKASDTPKVA